MVPDLVVKGTKEASGWVSEAHWMIMLKVKAFVWMFFFVCEYDIGATRPISREQRLKTMEEAAQGDLQGYPRL